MDIHSNIKSIGKTEKNVSSLKIKKMKKPRYLKNIKSSKPKESLKRCPMGGYCFNPVCLLTGCIEN